MTVTNNLNVLAWYTSLEYQNHRKEWAYGRTYPLLTPVNYILPFQLPRAKTGAAITVFRLVRWSDAQQIDILDEMVSSGLEVVEFPDEDAITYDLIRYPGSIPMEYDLGQGLYYCEMSDGTNTWYSELFVMTGQDAEDLIRIDYWHTERFCYPGGHIQYDYPYKSRVYIRSDIGKPGYEYEERVSKRDGYNFALQQISYKLYRFVMLAPEFLLDAFRVIRQHDYVEIFYKGLKYPVDEFLMGQADWQEQGDLAAVEVEFKTDSVVVINGRAVDSVDYEPAPGECLATDYFAVARIDEGGAEYLGGYYIGIDDEQYTLEAGNLVLINKPDGRIYLYEFDGIGWIPQILADEEVAYDENTGEYFYYEDDDGTFVMPTIASVDVSDPENAEITGFSFPNTFVEIWVVTDEGDVQRGYATAADFASGVIFDATGGEGVYIKVVSAPCGAFYTGTTFFYTIPELEPDGIDYMTLELDFIVR